MTEPKKPGYTPRAYREVKEIHAPQPLNWVAPASEKARRAEEAKLRRVFGERMYRARVEINGLPQLEAAKLLGFSNSSSLAKIEMGESFSRAMPVIAAKAYRVTTDFLLGVCDFDYECRSEGAEWEAAILSANNAFFQTAMREHAMALASIGRVTGVTVDGIAKIMAKTVAVKSVFERMIELNPEAWGDVRGGNHLEAVILELDRVCAEVQRTANRARIDLRLQTGAVGVSELIDARLVQIDVVRETSTIPNANSD